MRKSIYSALPTAEVGTLTIYFFSQKKRWTLYISLIPKIPSKGGKGQISRHLQGPTNRTDRLFFHPFYRVLPGNSLEGFPKSLKHQTPSLSLCLSPLYESSRNPTNLTNVQETQNSSVSGGCRPQCYEDRRRYPFRGLRLPDYLH